MKPTLPDGLCDKVLRCVKLYHADMRATREIIAHYCGLIPYTATADRQIRMAIKKLRDDMHPIISTSGKPGYYYSPEDVKVIQAELRARAYKLLSTAAAMEQRTGQMRLVL